LSESIRVRSIVGRFLEHSRVMAFAGGGTPEYWLGSADLMHRNLDRRVETLVRVQDPAVQAQLAWVLDRAMAPDIFRWDLGPDGTWTRMPADRPGQDLQLELMRRTRERSTA
jgi:polyphosphate kinase